MLQKIPSSLLEKYARELGEIEDKISRLEYVGAKKAGSDGYKPNIFHFTLEKIIAT